MFPAEDAEIAALARKSFVRQGIEILDGTKVSAVEKRDDGVIATLTGAEGASEKSRRSGCLGGRRRRQCRGARPRGARREVERGVMAVDGEAAMSREFSRSATWRAGRCWPTRRAEGIACVEAIARKNAHPRAKPHPRVHLCASAGRLGRADRGRPGGAGLELKIGRFPLSANGEAIALGEPEGLVKTIFDAKSGRLLGARLIGAKATELITGSVIAINLETTEEELMHSVFPHPTVSEAMHESVLAAYGRAIQCGVTSAQAIKAQVDPERKRRSSQLALAASSSRGRIFRHARPACRWDPRRCCRPSPCRARDRRRRWCCRAVEPARGVVVAQQQAALEAAALGRTLHAIPGFLDGGGDAAEPRPQHRRNRAPARENDEIFLHGLKSSHWFPSTGFARRRAAPTTARGFGELPGGRGEPSRDDYGDIHAVALSSLRFKNEICAVLRCVRQM